MPDDPPMSPPDAGTDPAIVEARDTPARPDPVVAYLNAADERCPACGYELRGAAANRCPECGKTFDVLLATSIAGPAWWWAAFLGTLVASLPLLGIFITRLYLIASLADQRFFRSVREQGLEVIADIVRIRSTLFLAVLVMLHVALIAWLIASRRAWPGWPRRRRTALGVLGLAMPLITFALILAYINV